MYLVAFPPQPTYQHFWVVLARNLKYNRFKTNYRDALNNDGGLPNCRFSSQTLSQANTTRLYETVNCISAESALLPRQINWLDLYICPTEFKQKERTREREREISSQMLPHREGEDFPDAELWFPCAFREWGAHEPSAGSSWPKLQLLEVLDTKLPLSPSSSGSWNPCQLHTSI